MNYVPPMQIEIKSECKRGSRDCFPEDRVGIGFIEFKGEVYFYTLSSAEVN